MTALFLDEKINYKIAVRSPQAGYDAAAACYDSWRWSQFWSANEAPALAPWLGRISNGPVLDAGCGSAKYLALIQQLGHEYVGVDISGNMLERGVKKATDAGIKDAAAFYTADMRQIPLKSDSVSGILCARALSHTEDVDDVFREFKRVLRSGGLVLISDIHPRHPYERTSIATPQGTVAIETFKHDLDALRDTARSIGGFDLLGLREYTFANLIWQPKDRFRKLRQNPRTPVFYTLALRKTPILNREYKTPAWEDCG